MSAESAAAGLLLTACAYTPEEWDTALAKASKGSLFAETLRLMARIRREKDAMWPSDTQEATE